MPTCALVKPCGTGPASCGPMDAPSTGNTLVLQDVPLDQCTGIVLITPSEYKLISANPFAALTPEFAAQIVALCGLIWFLAAGMRDVIRFIKSKDSDDE
ncbi:hypothetical protein [Chitinolyticbacter meiyuanensis]|uniref:hypothetical protein n=1 Tax=Chitinolyticbacter meiyuanensis TaxID=682798 RepID=UPI0011E5D151|nr:hypothetical protein [Chitinolyticbacter meiyuanensis]